MKRRSRSIITGVCFLFHLLINASVPALAGQRTSGPKPSATMDLFRVQGGTSTRERSMGLLHFRSEEFPIKVRGLSPIKFQLLATVQVYNLTRIEDLDGVFQLQAPSRQVLQCCQLSNEHGVVLRFIGEQSGGEIRLDVSGVTIAVASKQIAARMPMIRGGLGRFLPQSAGFGFHYIGPLLLTPTLNVETAGFDEVNNGWGGKFNEPLRNSRLFFEQSNEEGLNASLNLGRYGIIVGRVSAVFSMTGGGLDAEATNADNLHPWDYALESGYLEWASGSLFPELGYDAVTVSAGPQNFTIADGFLFFRGATNGGSRGATWLNPRTAFKQSGIVSLQIHDMLLQGFFLKPNDNPSTDTNLGGVNFETPVGEYATTGFTYCNIFDSKIQTENGLNVFYWREAATPIPAVADFHLDSAFAAESNGGLVSGATGWYVSPYYEFSQYSWDPKVYYRYASFSGGGPDGNRNFDPLFYGSSDWGSWYQGEILGNWVVTNSNLITHQVRLEFSPTPSTTVDLIFYKFLLYSTAQHLVNQPVMPVTSKNLADEIDLIVQYAPTPWWVIAVSLCASIPDQAARQITGGAQTWVQSMLTTGVTF